MVCLMAYLMVGLRVHSTDPGAEREYRAGPANQDVPAVSAVRGGNLPPFPPIVNKKRCSPLPNTQAAPIIQQIFTKLAKQLPRSPHGA